MTAKPNEMHRIGCMVRTAHSTCKRPVVFVANGSDGPFYRCGRHGAELLRQRDDVTIVDG